MTDHFSLLSEIGQQLERAIAQLEYSYNKVANLSIEGSVDDMEQLETWESFCARFSRVADIYSVKFVKLKVREQDPGFNGSFRDFLNYAEKINLISNVDVWMKIRELRNIVAHDYTVDNIEILFEKLRELAPILISVKSQFQR